jgi:hypothetical protein
MHQLSVSLRARHPCRALSKEPWFGRLTKLLAQGCGRARARCRALEREHGECRTTSFHRVASTAYEERLRGSGSRTSQTPDVTQNQVQDAPSLARFSKQGYGVLFFRKNRILRIKILINCVV